MRTDLGFEKFHKDLFLDLIFNFGAVSVGNVNGKNILMVAGDIYDADYPEIAAIMQAASKARAIAWDVGVIPYYQDLFGEMPPEN